METGYEVAKFIVEYGFENNIWPNEIYFHTDNPVGRKNMYQLLSHYCPDTTIVHRWFFTDDFSQISFNKK